MKESHRKDQANHPDPESCVGDRKAVGEALTGAHAGQPSSCEIRPSGAPTPLSEAEGHTEPGAHGEPDSGPAQPKTLHMRGNSLRGKREIPWTPGGDEPPGRPEKVNDRTSGVYVCGKSDGRVVPEKLPNKGGTLPPAEGVEEIRPRGTRRRLPRPGHRAGPARRWLDNVCMKWHVETDVYGSPRYRTTSAPCFFERAFTHSGVWQHRESTAFYGTSTMSPLTLRCQTPELRAGYGNSAPPDLCGGPPERPVPTATQQHAKCR